MLFLAAAVVAARFDEAGEEAVQTEEGISDQRVEDERKDGIDEEGGDAQRKEDERQHGGCQKDERGDQQPFARSADTVIQTFVLAQQAGSGDRHEQQRGQTEQKTEKEPQRIKSGKEKNENGKDDAKDKADDNRDDVIAFRVANNIAPLS